MNVAIIDYGLGNITSVVGAIEVLGATAVVTSQADDLAAADCLILPGVGAFGDGIAKLHDRGLVAPLTGLVQGGKPLLGICLGAQLLCIESEEFGFHSGLGWLPARVRRLNPSDSTLRVPHVGWDDVQQCRPSPLWDDVPKDALFYYTHSFGIVADDPDIVVGVCDYGGPFAAALQSGNVFGMQPHPEKSQRYGLKVLENYLRFADAA